MTGSRHLAFLTLASALSLLASYATADSYIIPPDYAVTCLDAETGEVLWQTQPPELDLPVITIAGDKVIAESERMIPPSTEALEKWQAEGASLDDYFRLRGRKHTTVILDSGGEIFHGETKPPAAGIGPLESLPQNLVASDGTVFIFDQGNTRHLLMRDASGPRLIRELPDFPHDLNIAGDLAIFSLAGNGGRLRGGEVFAWDLGRGALSWVFESWRHVGPPLHHLTDLAVDGNRVLVAVDQVVFALDLASGNLLWTTTLPRQDLRPWSNPWTRFGRHGGRLFVVCYEDLFVLSRDDGRLLWSFDPGPFGNGWPTIASGRVYLATRDRPADMASMSSGGHPSDAPPPSLVRVSRGRFGIERFVLELVTTDDLPPGAVAWSTLSEPPPAPGHSTSVVISLIKAPWTKFEASLEVGGILASEGEAYVKLADFTQRVAVRTGRKELAELVIRPVDSGSTPLPVQALGLGGLLLAITAVVVTVLGAHAHRSSAKPFRFPVLKKPHRRSMALASLAAFLLTLTLAGIGLAFVVFPAMVLEPTQFVRTVVAVMALVFLGSIVASNWLSLIGNRRLQLAARDAMASLDLPAGSVFVGMTEPDSRKELAQLVERHDDCGFLYLTEEKLIFEGSRFRREIPLRSIDGFAEPLIWAYFILHTRWLEILYRLDGESRTLRLESRERGSIRSNYSATQELRVMLEASIEAGTTPELAGG